jgi:hypothetical protein
LQAWNSLADVFRADLNSKFYSTGPSWAAPFKGCQMAYFQTKNPNLGRFWRVLQWKMVYFTVIWSILRPLGIFSGYLFGIIYDYLVYFPRFGMLYQKKSGIPCSIHFLLNETLMKISMSKQNAIWLRRRLQIFEKVKFRENVDLADGRAKLWNARAGWPDVFVKKCSPMCSPILFVKINTHLFPWK